MDEEDIREAEESRTLQTSDTFAGFGTANDPWHQDAVMDIFRSSGTSKGAELLKRMGWREGQGIGPRVKREADLGEGQTSRGELHTFAPDDVPVMALTPKTDSRGLGYEDVDGSISSKFGPSKQSLQSGKPSAEDEDDDDSSQGTLQGATSLFGPRRGPKVRKTGFGVGVLNDTGSDDDDPYAVGPKISYNKTIGGDKPVKKTKKPKARTANPILQSKPVFMSKKLAGLQGQLRKCHDGRLPLDGFELGDDLDSMASLSLNNDEYKPPVVPPDWVSSIDSASDGHVGEDAQYVSTADAAKASKQTFKSRAAALGESQLPGKSVFDFLSPAARDRLASASGKTNLPPGLGEVPEGYTSSQPTSKSLQDLVPRLDQDAALQALARSSEAGGGWMPYGEDLAKRDRYKTFLEIRGGLRSTSQGDELPPRAPEMSQDDWVTEMQEFSRAAEVFRPVSGFMASRFTSSTAGQAQSSETQAAGHADTLLTYKRTKPEDPAENAAKMGMFGHMTRSTSNFYPTRLLCKRFGVAMPNISDRSEQGSSFSGTTTAYESINTNRFQSAGYQPNEKSEPLVAQSSPSATAPAPSSTEHTSLAKTVNPDENAAVERQKPDMSLFKAVFGSDDEDDDD